MRAIALLICALFSGFATATGPADFLAAYADQAKQADPGFTGFSAKRGRGFYFHTHTIDDGSELSCAPCDHADPRKGSVAHKDQIPCRACHVTLHTGSQGRSAVKREIPPIAPSAQPDRFTNEWKVEAWFGWNCQLLLKR